ncbi:flagellar protein FlgN [Caldichromatium japonicum]|uniref:Flagellar protein FlgN n=1 Tax=Caldichromatium japonicum TaxID=2699430 RepID=A0A6G7VDN5_9GAMM|nr:flagellar protein FlgN [Caldichromatium japonicum]QIK37986.1 flagellar protein FlgN [Caldichromatium japonicum]
MNPNAAGQSSAAGFFAALERVQESMRQLGVLLGDEIQAVEAKNIEALQRQLDAKQRLVAEIESQVACLRQTVEASGFSFTAGGIADFIQSQDTSGLALGQWTALIDETRSCARLNCELGQLVERQQRRIALALSLLLGEEAKTTTYDPRGRPVAGSQSGRTLDQA